MKQFEFKEEPNYFKEFFDFNKIPVIQFDDKPVQMTIPEEIWITDTTFRDGQQARAPYKIEDIVELYKLMHVLSGKLGVIRQSEFFVYTKRDREVVQRCLELGYKYPEITGWIRSSKKDISLIKELGLKETGILTSVSDYHIHLKFRSNRRQIMKEYLSVVDTVLEEGIRPRCHLEDITRADFPGFVIPFVQKLMKKSEKSGIPIKIRACDTLGLGLPFPNSPLPRSVPKIFESLRKEAGVPVKNLEWHGHNDFHKVLVNGTTAWLYNCSSVNGTLLGLGERTGNTPIEGLLMDYIALNGGDPEKLGIDTTIITKIANYYRDIIGEEISPNYPFVGEDFNLTRAGIHIDGIDKNESIYNSFNLNRFLNRPPAVSINDKSGSAGIAFWLNSYFDLKGDLSLKKTDPGIQKIYNWVMKEYENHRISCITQEEILEQAKQTFPSIFGLDNRSKKIINLNR